MTTTHRGRGSFAATALTKVMSGDMTTGLKLVVGPNPGYEPVSNTLVLPGIPAGDLPDETLDKLLAYLGHEAAERGDSTWMPQDPRWAGNPGLKSLVNGINDARIDLLQADRYPGWGMKMRQVRIDQGKRMVVAYRKGELEPSVKAFASLALLVGEGLLTVEKLYKLFPDWAKFLRRAEPILSTLDLSSEERCIEQALALYKALQEKAPEPPQQQAQQGGGEPSDNPQNDGDDQDGEAGQDGEGQGEGEPQADAGEDDAEGAAAPVDEGGPDDDAPEPGVAPAAGADGDREGERGAGDGADGGDGDAPDSPQPQAAPQPSALAGDQPGNAQDDARAPGQGDGNGHHVVDDDGAPLDDGDGAPDLQEALLDDILGDLFAGQDYQKPSNDNPFTADYRSNQPTTYTYDPSWDLIETPRPAKPLNRSVYGRAAQVLTTKLRQAMTAPAMRHVRNRDRGELDERAIARFVVGDENVFHRRTRQESDSVACVVSWDESSSMTSQTQGGRGPSRLSVVRDLAYTWNEALGKLDIPTELLGWGSYTDNIPNRFVYRRSRLRHRIYKTFDEGWKHPTVLGRLGAIGHVHSTPTAEGLLYAAERLGRRSENRRILFFLTDGEPGTGVSGDRRIHEDFIETVRRRCERSGIEVIGIGIGIDIGHLFPMTLTVHDVTDLYRTASDELLRLLRRNR